MALKFVRYGLPALLILAGFACLIFADGSRKIEGWALFTGGGLSVLVLNVLYRIGASGDTDREREEQARRYFDEHGVWPDDPAPRKDEHRWRLPPGVATPESEAAERERSKQP
jgi:hypothetical protein